MKHSLLSETQINQDCALQMLRISNGVATIHKVEN